MKTISLSALFLGSLFVSTTAMAEPQTITDIKNTCKIIVPENFVAGPVKSVSSSPDHSIIATVHGLRPAMTWEQATTLARMSVKPIDTLEEAGERLVFTFASSEMPGAAADSTCKYVVAKNPANVCTAQVCVSKAGDQSVAASILGSLAGAS